MKLLSWSALLVIGLTAQAWGSPVPGNNRVIRSSHYPKPYKPPCPYSRPNYPPPGSYPQYPPAGYGPMNNGMGAGSGLPLGPQRTPEPIGPTTITLLEHFAPVPPRPPMASGSHGSHQDGSSDSQYY